MKKTYPERFNQDGVRVISERWPHLNQNTLARDFLERFTQIGEGFKLRISGKEVRAFIKQQKLKPQMTLDEFNMLMHCLGRTTGNKYVYDMLFLTNAAMEKTKLGRRKTFTGQVKVPNYYGSKRHWSREFKLLYKHTYDIGCRIVVDAFAGSGFLALLASKTGVFNHVILNEFSNAVFNYHLVQKDEESFGEFIRYIGGFFEVDKYLFSLIKKDLSLQKEEKRVHISKGNATRAAEFFIVKHCAHSGQGGYIEGRMAPAWYVDSLQDTHELYKDVTLSHLHYSKIVKKYFNNNTALLLLDPPYLSETRVQKKSYQHEFSERQHRSLLQLLTKQDIQAKVVLCGYHSSLYERYFMRDNKAHGTCWHEVKLLRAGSRQEGAEAKERIWVNFDISSLVNNHGDLFEFIW